ncbi:MAG: SDR family NAD(P)-dependent oxidoreductase [Bacilli bacterium]|nr:SDR family NAD(P)-dependent oxidoreductase [Bacilli bacterium]
MDKYVFITNANSQVGNDLVKKFISENYIVLAGDIGYENKKFGNLIYVNLDTASYKSLDFAKKYIQKYTSKISAIIHLGNYQSFTPLIEAREEEILKSIEDNFMSAFRTNQMLWDLLEVRNGKIIHDCSDVSLYNLMPFNGLYSITKSLLKNYNDVLRRELKNKAINVIRIHTGIIKNEGYDKLIDLYHNESEKSKLFFGEMSRFFGINIPKDETITSFEYSEFIVGIVNTKFPKQAYYFKCSKKLKFIDRLPRAIRNMYLKNYQK